MQEFDYKKYLQDRKAELEKQLSAGGLAEGLQEEQRLSREVDALERKVHHRRNNPSADRMLSVLSGSKK